MQDPCCVILTTTGNQEEAQRIAEMLVKDRLAACVQITHITSTYLWKGKLNTEPEYLLLIKTTARRYREVEAAINAHHSYELPEVVQIPIAAGSDRYLSWVNESTQAESPM